MKEKLKESQEKIKLNKRLPYVVSTIQEILDEARLLACEPCSSSLCGDMLLSPGKSMEGVMTKP